MSENYVLKDFKITASVMKTYEQVDLFADKPIRRYIVGKASGAQVDREGERMAHSALEAFQRAIEAGIYTHQGVWSLVPLVSTHDVNGVGETEWDKVIGYITKAWLDDSYDLWIEAELDEDNATAEMLYRKLTRPTEPGRPIQLGLSVGGRIIAAGGVWDHGLAKEVFEYQDVALRHVMVTSAPAYPTEYMTALSKSVNWNKVTRAVAPSEEDSMSELTENVEKSEEIVEEQVEDVTKAEEVEAVAEAVEKSAEVVEETEAVEKSEAAVEQESEVAKSEFDALREQVDVLTKSITEVATAMEKLLTPAQTDEDVTEVAEKSETLVGENGVETVAEAVVEKSEVVEETVEDVAKSEDTPGAEAAFLKATLDTALEKSMTSLVDQFSAKLTEAIAPLTKRMDELENEEVDKSIAVTRASDVTKGMLDGNSDYLEKMQSKRGSDAIAAIFEN